MSFGSGCVMIITGGTPNTVSLDDHYGGLSNSFARLGSTRPHWKLRSGFRFDRSLLTPTATALGFGFS